MKTQAKKAFSSDEINRIKKKTFKWELIRIDCNLQFGLRNVSFAFVFTLPLKFKLSNYYLKFKSVM